MGLKQNFSLKSLKFTVLRIYGEILLFNAHFSFQKGKKPLKGRNNLKILIACEESQIVCAEMRKLGHEAYSADIQEPSGGHPEWHILGDVLPLINGKCRFTTMDGTAHQITGKWDLLIAHPPCTYLTSAGACRLMPKGKLDKSRLESGIAAKEFFLKFYYADCDKICIENPAPMKIYSLPPYSQIIQPCLMGLSMKRRLMRWTGRLMITWIDRNCDTYIHFFFQKSIFDSLKWIISHVFNLIFSLLYGIIKLIQRKISI